MKFELIFLFLSDTDKIRFILWLFRYIGAFLCFVIGLGAPGVPKRRYGLMIVI